MRVLMVAHGYPPGAQAGTESYTEALTRSLVRAGETVRVLCREGDPARPERSVRRELRDGYEVLFVNNTLADSRAFEDSWKNSRLSEAVLPFIDSFAPEVAHLQHLTWLSTDMVSALDARGVPIVFTLNDFWLSCQRGQLLDRELERCQGPAPERCARCLGVPAGAHPVLYRAASAGRALERWATALSPPLQRVGRVAASLTAAHWSGAMETDRRLREVRALCERVDSFVCPSVTVRDHFLGFGLDPAKLLLVRQGVDPAPFAGLARTSSPTLRVGFLGTLMSSKAPHLLLEALASLPPGRASVHLHGSVSAYHGDDSYRRRLEPLLALPGVHHHGPVPHCDVPKVLASLDVLVVPSIWLENAPFVIGEAALAGVPTVGSDLGGIRELVRHEQTGLLFRPGSSDSISRALRRLIDEPELLPRLKKGLIPPRTLEEDARELRGLYSRLFGARQPPPGRPELAAVVLNYRTLARTLECLDSIERGARRPDALRVVDNDSDDGSASFLRARLGPSGLLHTERNRGFSGGANAGIEAVLAQGAKRVLLVNGDAELGPRTLERLEAALEADPSLGVVGPVVLSRDDRSRVETDGISWNPRTGRMRHPGCGSRYTPGERSGIRRVDGVSGACMLLTRQLLETIGDFEPEYFFTFEDLDLCLRARAAGFGVACVDDAVAFHRGGASLPTHSPRRTYFAARNHLLLARRHASGGRAERLVRGSAIVALNVAQVLRRAQTPKTAGLAAVARGVLDYARGRFGSDD